MTMKRNMKSKSRDQDRWHSQFAYPLREGVFFNGIGRTMQVQFQGGYQGSLPQFQAAHNLGN